MKVSLAGYKPEVVNNTITLGSLWFLKQKFESLYIQDKITKARGVTNGINNLMNDRASRYTDISMPIILRS